MFMKRFKHTALIAMFLLVMVIGVGAVVANNQGANALATELSIDPNISEVAVGNQATADVSISDVIDLYGIAMEIHFDPSIVQVVDADPGTAGVQITSGSCPEPGFTLAKTADNVLGTINYDTASLAPSPPCNGIGIVASITFEKIAVGTSPIHFDSWLLSDTQGMAIPTGAVDGEIRDPAGPPTLLWLDPQFPEISVGNSGLVDLRLDDVSNVYGIQVTLDYDPLFLDVVGGAVTPGVCPAPDFVVSNTAGGGTISYGATQLANQHPDPCNGGVVATIEFLCLPDTPADTLTDVIITDSLISDPDGTPISHAVRHATVKCVEIGFYVEGSVTLQGWPTELPELPFVWPEGWPLGADGVEVILMNDTDGVVADRTFVGPDGAFSLIGTLDKTHTLIARHPRYLEIAESGITSTVPNEVINVGNGKLPAGDLTGYDGVINILDLTIVGGNFMKSAPQPWVP